MFSTISLSYWWLGCLSYLLSHILHILLWNKKFVRNDFLFLVLFFYVLPVLFYALLALFSAHSMELLIPLFLHFVLSTNYLMIYPAFQASSPTIRILSLLRRNQNGLTQKEILHALSKHIVIEDFYSSLKSSHLISIKKEVYSLTYSGKILASFFLVYRKCLGLKPGIG